MSVAMERAEPERPRILHALMQTLDQRRGASPEISYVAGLYKKGPAAIREKLAEESAELIAASNAHGPERARRLIHEGADLLFHTLVLVSWAGVNLDDIEVELARRFGTSGLVERASRKGEAEQHAR